MVYLISKELWIESVLNILKVLDIFLKFLSGISKT